LARAAWHCGIVLWLPADPPSETLEEARMMAANAIRGSLECLQEDRLPLPPSKEHDRQPIREEVAVTLEVA